MKTPQTLYQYTFQSPVGLITLFEMDETLVEISFDEESISNLERKDQNSSRPLLRKAERELKEYFCGERKSFTLPLSPHGTSFQRSVWRALEKIPFGETRSYQDIAKKVGNQNASRAVGMANRKNPLPIVIPCHRVIGKNGSLTGYAGGLERKKRLLEIERLSG